MPNQSHTLTPWDKTAPTPAPWTIEHITEALNGPVRLCDSGGQFVCRVEACPDSLGQLTGYPANVTHLVRCVNSHDALVAALRLALADVRPMIAPLGPPLTEHVDKWPAWVVVARAALAAASEKS